LDNFTGKNAIERDKELLGITEELRAKVEQLDSQVGKLMDVCRGVVECVDPLVKVSVIRLGVDDSADSCLLGFVDDCPKKPMTPTVDKILSPKPMIGDNFGQWIPGSPQQADAILAGLESGYTVELDPGECKVLLDYIDSLRDDEEPSPLGKDTGEEAKLDYKAMLNQYCLKLFTVSDWFHFVGSRVLLVNGRECEIRDVSNLKNIVVRFDDGEYEVVTNLDIKDIVKRPDDEHEPLGKDRNGTDVYESDDFAHCSMPKIIHRAKRVVDGILIASDGTQFGFEWIYLVNAGPNNPNYRGE
jgi:hypothetical protein